MRFWMRKRAIKIFSNNSSPTWKSQEWHISVCVVQKLLTRLWWKLSAAQLLSSFSSLSDAFFREYLEDRPGLDDSTPKSNDHIEFPHQRSYQYHQYHTRSIPPPSRTNSWIPRSRRYLVPILTRIYQLCIGLISLFSAVSSSILEH